MSAQKLSREPSEASIQRQLDQAQRLMKQQHHPQPQPPHTQQSWRAPPSTSQGYRKAVDPKRAEHDQFHAAILNLKLDTADGAQKAGKKPDGETNRSNSDELPSSFESHSKYVQLFSPLVLEEIRAELQVARGEAEDARIGELTDLSAPEGLFQFFTLQIPSTEGRGRDGQRDYESQDCLLVELTKFRWVAAPKVSSPRGAAAKGSKPTSPRGQQAAGKWESTAVTMEVLALVAGASSVEVNRQRVVALRLKCRASLDLTSKAGAWRDSSSKRRLQFKVTKLKNIGVCVREWRSVRQLEGNPALCPRVLRPDRRPAAADVEGVLARLNPEVRAHLESRSNASQLRALAAACDPGSRASSGFTLLQGPPGTGKTSVILSILNYLHLTEYQRHYDAIIHQIRAKLLGEAPPVEVEGAMAGTLGEVLAGVVPDRQAILSARLPEKPRILVCAPSNAAVDHLVERLLTEGLRDATRSYAPDMIRVGNPHACSHRVKVVTLDHQVEEATKRGDIEEVKARYRHLMQKRKMQEEEFKGVGEAMHGLLIQTQIEIENVKRDLQRCELVQSNRSRKEELKEMLRTAILDEAQVVFTTLNSAGSDFFTKMKTGFRTVIIDEACQAVEASTLIPLSAGPQTAASRCILVGDPRQLPATVISQTAGAAIYQRSLFERLEAAGHAVLALDTQYRMHPQIRLFPSDYFYQGGLRDGANVAEGLRGQPYQRDPWFSTLTFYDLPGSRQSRGGGQSLRNREEACLVADLCHSLFLRYSRNGELRGRVAVLTPYRQQRAEIAGVLRRRMGDCAVAGEDAPGRREREHDAVRGSVDAQIDVMTVDACQGQERDVVLFSCVRAASGGVGFLNDVRRMNVALTRAKHSLLVVGNSSALSFSPPWRAFLASLHRRRRILLLPSHSLPPNFHRPPPPTPASHLADLLEPPRPPPPQPPASRDRAPLPEVSRGGGLPAPRSKSQLLPDPSALGGGGALEEGEVAEEGGGGRKRSGGEREGAGERREGAGLQKGSGERKGLRERRELEVRPLPVAEGRAEGASGGSGRRDIVLLDSPSPRGSSGRGGGGEGSGKGKRTGGGEPWAGGGGAVKRAKEGSEHGGGKAVLLPDSPSTGEGRGASGGGRGLKAAKAAADGGERRREGGGGGLSKGAVAEIMKRSQEQGAKRTAGMVRGQLHGGGLGVKDRAGDAEGALRKRRDGERGGDDDREGMRAEKRAKVEVSQERVREKPRAANPAGAEHGGQRSARAGGGGGLGAPGSGLGARRGHADQTPRAGGLGGLGSQPRVQTEKRSGLGGGAGLGSRAGLSGKGNAAEPPIPKIGRSGAPGTGRVGLGAAAARETRKEPDPVGKGNLEIIEIED